MKNKIYLFIIAVAGLMTACSPITEEGPDPQVISADQFEGSVTAVSVDGHNSNKIRCKSTSPVACQWSDGITTLSSNDGEMLLFITGEQTITCTAMNQDGSTFQKQYTVNVEKMDFAVDPTYGYLCGTGSKTWVWDGDTREDGRFWGNGGRNSDTEPTWWGRDASDIDQEDSYNNYGADASMTFDMSGLKFEKTSGDGSKHESGTFKISMNDDQTGWSKGSISIAGTTILQGVSQNDNKKVVHDFIIIYIDADRMVLAYNTESSDGESWFWMFKAKK